MQLAKVADRLRAQLHQFPGIFSPRFSKPQARFLEQMLFGISASQDCKPSAISRALGEPITLKKTEERLSHHLAVPQLGRAVHQQLVAHAARSIHADTLIVVDPTDIRKPYAEKMPHLATVRDGSTGELVTGYWACVALACEPATRRVLPLMQELWSAEAQGGEKRIHLEYGFRRVKRPGRRVVELTLMVVRGFGEQPLLVLTNVAVKNSRRSLWRIVSGYLTRWLVEETIRFLKQSYRLEDLRVLDLLC
jgi:hypothetical protein